VRTTIDIDADVLAAIKELAEHRKTTAGRVISDLARQALTRGAEISVSSRNGFDVLPRRGGVVTTELVKRLGEDEA
jgi:hypothetical protein